MEKVRDLLIFIIIVAIGVYYWNIKQKDTPAPKETAPQQSAPQKNIVKDKAFKLKYNFIIQLNNSNAKTVTLTIPVPTSDKTRQNIQAINFSHKPSQIYMSDDSKYAKVVFTNPKQTKIDFSMTIDSNLHIYDYQRAVSLNRNYDKATKTSRYLKPEKNIEVSSPTIKSAASTIKGGSQIEILQNINSYMTQKVKLANSTQTIGAEKSLKNGSAGPGDFVNIFVALTRAKSIPARIVSGYTVGHYGGTRQAWAEVYFKEYGWVTFDIKNSPVDITSLNSFYIVSANNSIRADSLTTTFDKIPTTGRVDTYFQVLNK